MTVITTISDQHPVDAEAARRRSSFFVVPEPPVPASNWEGAEFTITTAEAVRHDSFESERAESEGQQLHMRFQCVGTGVLVTLSGALDGERVSMLDDILQVPAVEGFTKLYLDLHEVTSIDVVAAHHLTDLVEHGAAERPLDICIIRPSEAMVRLRELVGI